jgi:hypothetical protein
VQGWEQGRREPSLEWLLPIARALGVGVEALLAEEPPAAKKKGK